MQINRQLLTGLVAMTVSAMSGAIASQPPVLGSRAVPVIDADGIRFRDLDRDGALSRFEDWRLSPAERSSDLIARLTLDEKAGLMVHASLRSEQDTGAGAADRYNLDLVRGEIVDKHINSFITRLPVSPQIMAEQNNVIQEIGEQHRLGIPITISTDPRNHFDAVHGAGVSSAGYSRWPDFIGFGALADAKLMRHFADIVRAEYRATGIHQALSPQADLFTEPRWPRGTGTFGSNPELVHDLVRAYVAGFQGSDNGLQANGVLTVVKHWVGYGATPNGWDGHNAYGRYAEVNENSFSLHVRAFEGAFDVGVGGVMPTYSIVRGANINGVASESVGGGFSNNLLNGYLRKRYGFRGIVLSDWAITLDCNAECMEPTKAHGFSEIAMPWGVEQLTPLQRYALGVNAGIDQFGGVSDPSYIVEAVNGGLISSQRVDEAVGRILESKFLMGLFENPFVDAEAAAREVGRADVQREASAVQSRAQVLLKNADGLLPLAAGSRVFLVGLDAGAALDAGLQPVDSPEAADVAIVSAATPHELVHPHHFFGSRQHEGRLDLRAGDDAYDHVASLSATLPVVLAIYADRPPVLTAIEPMSSAILVNFGVSDAGILQVLSGRERPEGRLPFEFPSSMAAVEAQDPAVPDDSLAPLYTFGARLDLPLR